MTHSLSWQLRREVLTAGGRLRWGFPKAAPAVLLCYSSPFLWRESKAFPASCFLLPPRRAQCMVVVVVLRSEGALGHLSQPGTAHRVSACTGAELCAVAVLGTSWAVGQRHLDTVWDSLDPLSCLVSRADSPPLPPWPRGGEEQLCQLPVCCLPERAAVGI